MTDERKKSTWYGWLWRNTLGSKTTIGVAMIIVSPLTGPLAPGVLAAGQFVATVGVADKVIKNRAEIGALIGGLVSGFFKNKKEKNDG
jgi:hypothetical protein